jgi:Bacterial Ig-like domain (group 1)/RTX calcium-binding nonapeptide repeat (4 copies)
MGLIRIRRSRAELASILTVAMVLSTTIVTLIAPEAQATHPMNSCLDVSPETDTNTAGDTHTLTARLVAQNTSNPLVPTCPGGSADAPSAQTVAATALTVIDFEITGANNLDGNSTTNDPDLTCSIPVGQSSCTTSYVGPTTGTDTIRGWVVGDTIDTDEEQSSSEEELPDPAGDEPDTTDVVTKTWVAGAASRLDCSPETDQNETGDSHTVTCTATDQFGNGVSGQEIDWELEGANDPDDVQTGTPDYECTTNSSGSCSMTTGPLGSQGNTSSTEAGTTTYRAWLDKDGTDSNITEADNTEGRCAESDGTNADEAGCANESGVTETPGETAEPDTTDVVTKTWVSAPLNCSPETDVNPTGTNHTITCTARNAAGALSSGILIDVEAYGANPVDSGDSPGTPDFTCTTDVTGTCSVTHGPAGRGTTNDFGTTLYRAWVDEDGVHTGTANPAAQSHGNYEGDQGEGPYTGSDPDASSSQTSTAQPGNTAEPDKTDVVSKTWTASRIDCSPETDINPSGEAHTITCSTTGVNTNTFGAGVVIHAEATGANDPDSAETLVTPDFTCTTNAQGRCSFSHGPGGTGTTNSAGTTTYRAWINVDSPDASDDQTVEADTDETRVEGSDQSEPDNTDVVEKTWIASRLECSPETDTNPAGTSHIVTCTATDAAGAVVSGTAVDAEATGPNDIDAGDSPTSPDFSCTTASNGQCSFTHGTGGRGTTDSFGQTFYRAWIDADNADGTTEADITEARDESSGAGSTSEPDDTDVVEKNWSAVPTTLTIVPDTDTAPVGSCNPFTITATDASGNPVQHVVVDVEQRHANSDNGFANDEPTVLFCTPSADDGASNPSDVDPSRGDLGDGSDGTIGGEAENNTDAQGKVTIGIRVRPAEGTDGSGEVLVTAFYESEDNDDADTDDPQDSATKTWTPSQARTIDCAPEEAQNRVGTSHTVTCTVRDADGELVSGEGVTFTEEGPGEIVGDSTDNTSENGQATVETTSDEAGTQTIIGTLSSSTDEETDECDKAADDPTGSPQGVCSDSVNKEWKPAPKLRSGPCKGFAKNSTTNRNRGGKVIVGTNGADVLRGTNKADIICGLGGKDKIVGRGGNDILSGGGGADSVKGGGGRDRAQGNGGKDLVTGGGGNDRLLGGAGDDTLRGDAGGDVLRGGGGNDRLEGGSGRDELDGGPGTDACAATPAERDSSCES